VYARRIVQDQPAYPLRKLEREGRHDPSAERMAEERSAGHPEVGQESIQHFDETADPIVDERLVRTPETRQVDGDDAMRSRQAVEAERPLVGVPPTPWTSTSGGP
jgi:hypothetical protein